MPDYKTIVIKIGTTSLVDPQGKLDVSNLRRIVSETSTLVKSGKKIILVTSGAIITGAEKLGIIGKPKTIPEKQAAAAVGQSVLMRQYEKAFEEFGITVAQILLTRDAIADRERYLNARHTISTLLEEKVVPIVNENDTVAVEEIKVGDNDTLSALVASLIGADLLIILSDTDGFYMNTEEGVPYLIPEVKKITEEIEEAAGHPSTQLGTGGMITKIQAAKICTDSGIPVVIAHGRKERIIGDIVSGKKVGTIFYPKAGLFESRKRWLAHGQPPKGSIIIDEGAEKALKERGGSLLAVGIKEVKGHFEIGETITLLNIQEKEIGRGLTNYPSAEINKIKGLKSERLAEVLGYHGSHEIIHRDNLALL